MIRYLLDTNVLSSLMPEPRGSVRVRVDAAARFDVVYTSIIVAAEIRFGAAKKRSSRLKQQVEAVLAEISLTSFAEPVDRTYGELRATLDRAGTPIGANDLWIAAQALHDESVLVTDNVREFGRVPGLKVENWLRA